MVKRVYGLFNNGPTVDFVKVGLDKWQIVVPKTSDGEYIVSIWAEDESGNTSYYATMLFIIKAYEVIAVKQLPDYVLKKLPPEFMLQRIAQRR